MSAAQTKADRRASQRRKAAQQPKGATRAAQQLRQQHNKQYAGSISKAKRGR